MRQLSLFISQLQFQFLLIFLRSLIHCITISRTDSFYKKIQNAVILYILLSHTCMSTLSFHLNSPCWNPPYPPNGWVVMGTCEMNRGGRGASSVSDYVKVISVCSNFLTPVCLLVNHLQLAAITINRTARWVTTGRV